MFKDQMNLYEKYPNKLIFITETSQTNEGELLTEKTNLFLSKKYQNIEAKFVKDLNFNKISLKESFLEQA